MFTTCTFPTYESKEAWASRVAWDLDSPARLRFLVDRTVSPGGRIVASLYLSQSGEEN